MRIGIYTNCYFPIVNGVVGTVNLLRKGFLELGHEAYVFAPDVDRYQDDEEGVFRYPSINLTSKIKYPVALPFSSSLKKQAVKLNFDLIHVHHPFVLGPLALKFGRKEGISVTYTFHTQYELYSHYIPLPKGVVAWSAKRQVCNFCQAVDQVTTPAASAQQILLDYGVTTSIKVIPNPIDLGRFRNASRVRIRAKYGLNEEKLLINVGRVSPEKNLNLLLDSFKLMQEKTNTKQLKLMIVGDGPNLESLKEQARRLKIEAQVIFTGMVAPTEIPDFLKAADLFIMTSFSEVKPLAQLEALASGLPVVSVAAIGANDTISNGENGLLVEGDVSEISKAVLGLVFNENRMKNFCKKALLTADEYSYLKISKQYLDLFEKLIHKEKICS